MSNISYLPSEGMSYDPSEALYWDAEALGQELTRVYEVCHGCRMCFKYCDSFPILFKAIDDVHDGDVRKVTAVETEQVMDACFQCKLCEVQCPYTPRDQHEFQLDFPKLVHRYKAIHARGKGKSLQQRLLANPNLSGKLARMSFGMANAMNRVKFHRIFMEKLIGVHRDKLLPDFAASTFTRWAKRNDLIKTEPGGEVVLFQTCFVENNEPEIGRDTVEVLQANKVDVRCAAGFACCGMPHWERGDLTSLREQARTNLDILMPFVERGAKVVAINPTCSMMLRREYPELLEGADRERAKTVAEAVRDPGEFLWAMRKEERFNTDIKSKPPGGTVAYHAPCHLRAQGVGFKGRDLIRKLTKSKVVTVMECCGHDGTFAMTTEGFEPSIRIGKKSFDGMKEGEASTWSTDCPLAAVQFQQHAGVKPMHPMSILARCYREDGFAEPRQLPAPSTDSEE